jgi:hypothetical protein
MSRLPHFLDNLLTDVGGEVVSLTCRPRFTSDEDSWYSFLLKEEYTKGYSGAGRIRSSEKNPMTSLGTEAAIFRLVAQGLIQIRYRSPSSLNDMLFVLEDIKKLA